MDKSLPTKDPLRGENERAEQIELRATPKRITHFTARLKLPETARRKSKRSSTATELPCTNESPSWTEYMPPSKRNRAHDEGRLHLAIGCG